jgi:hypothetical protein
MGRQYSSVRWDISTEMTGRANIFVSAKANGPFAARNVDLRLDIEEFHYLLYRQSDAKNCQDSEPAVRV